MADHVEKQQFTEKPEPDGYDFDHDGSIEARVVRKLDWNIMPLFFVLCEHEKPLLLLRHGLKDRLQLCLDAGRVSEIHKVERYS